jgi:hypothetical protein
MPTYSYPTSAALELVEQDLRPRIEQDRPVFGFFPIVNEDAAEIIWEQRDNYIGLQQVRGLGGEPPRVKKTGVKRYVVEPGAYGEFETLNEVEITRRRQLGTFATPVELNDLVAPVQMKLLQRRYDRIEWMIWTLLANGTFSVSGPSGAVLHTDSYTTQSFTALTPWATYATATPLNDFRQVQLLARGHSVDFGAVSMAYMNQGTLNNLLNNGNNADLYGRRTAGLATFNNLTTVNQLMQGDNLPQIAVYDKGFLDDFTNFQLYIPTNTVIVVGVRPLGEPVGHYCYTRNINRSGSLTGAGPYTRVIDLGENKVPREFQVHDGHNGGLKLFYPSAIVVMHV